MVASHDDDDAQENAVCFTIIQVLRMASLMLMALGHDQVEDLAEVADHVDHAGS